MSGHINQFANEDYGQHQPKKSLVGFGFAVGRFVAFGHILNHLVTMFINLLMNPVPGNHSVFVVSFHKSDALNFSGYTPNQQLTQAKYAIHTRAASPVRSLRDAPRESQRQMSTPQKGSQNDAGRCKEGLDDMTPAITQNDARDVGGINTKLFADGRAGHPSNGTDFPHICLRQFVPVVVFAVLYSCLHSGIKHVVIVSAEKEVVRSDTFPVIAMVTNKKSGWNGTDVEKPRNTMSQEGDSGSIGKPDLAIPTSIGGSCPHPAAITFMDLVPKSLSKFCLFNHFRRYSIFTHGLNHSTTKQ